MEEEELGAKLSSIPVKPSPGLRAKLMLVNGGKACELVGTLEDEFKDVGLSVTFYDAEGDLNHVKAVRDGISRLLKSGKHCIVRDRLVQKERQEAWLKVAQRNLASCDVFVESSQMVKVEGFLNIFTLPMKLP
jgi:hypothetical protein